MFESASSIPIVISAASRDRLQNLVSDAVHKGAEELFTFPHATERGATQMLPVILENVFPDSDIYHTESFGPVATLFTIESDDEAIKLANDTEYGLTAAIYTRDLTRGFKLASRIHSGYDQIVHCSHLLLTKKHGYSSAVHINSPTIQDEPTLPHGGVKNSGYGRFGGSRGLDEFLQTKVITWKIDY